MAQRIVVDPITRIEGHLKIEVEIENGKVKNAWSSGTLFRGIEMILQGRDPRDAWLFTQRACGVCTYVHGLASVRCVDDAMDVTVPAGARLLRNLMMGAQFLHDHIVHFYNLSALDWVDMLSALKADPKKAAEISNSIGETDSGVNDYKDTQTKLKGFVDSGQLGPFANAYWGHPAYKLPPEINLIGVKHYLDCLKMQVKAAQLHAIFGGKNPHIQSLVVGGVTCARDLNADRLAEFLYQLKEVKAFVDNIYIPDILAIAGYYKDWGGIGGTTNFLAYGEFPQSEEEPGSLFFPRGAVFKRNLSKVDAVDVGQIQEHVAHSWYEGAEAKNPAQGETKPNFTGYDTGGKYSWLKAPRYNGESMEVGPLSRVLVAYAAGNEAVKKSVDDALAKLGVGPEALFSTLGRHAARALETKIIADAMVDWTMELITLVKDGKADTYQEWDWKDGMGAGLNDVPRGALGHWIDVKDKKIANYQMVVPSTWNLGPRCAAGKLGPVEEALIGTPIADPKQPLEILRTIHSFDPCIACAVHVIDPHTNEVYKIRVV